MLNISYACIFAVVCCEQNIDRGRSKKEIYLCCYKNISKKNKLR